MLRSIVITYFLLAALSAGAENGPTNIYVIPDDPYKPVVVSALGSAQVAPDQKFIGDPTLVTLKRKKEVTLNKPKPSRVKPHAQAQLSFKKIAISGRMANPRVAFKTQRLPLARLDQKLNTAFYEKILKEAPANNEL